MKAYQYFKAEKRYIPFLFILGCAILMVVPMILSRNFYADWFRSIWLIQYYGEYFRSHLAFPDVINTFGDGKYVSQVGMTHPIYYGVWVYRLLGLFCALLGGSPRKALMVVVFCFAFCEGYVWYKALVDLVKVKWITCSFVGSIVLAIYTVSTLYTGNAIPQHFGATSISIATGIWILSMQRRKKMKYWFLVAFFFTFGAGSHPITALLGGIFMAGLIIVTLFGRGSRNRKNEIVSGIGAALLSFLILFPWIYAVLTCIINAVSYGSIEYRMGADNWWIRLYPLPLNYQTVLEGPRQMISPFSGNQINIILLILFMTLTIIVNLCKKIIKREKLVSDMLFALYFFILGISMFPTWGEMLPDAMGVIQFSVRFVYYINLIGVSGIAYELFLLKKAKIDLKNVLQVCAIISIVLTSVAFMQNVLYSKAIEGILWYDTSHKTKLTDAFYNPHDYTNVTEYAGVVKEDKELPIVSIPVSETEFGKTQIVTIEANGEECVGVNVYPHKWNGIYVDGKKINNKNILVGNSLNYLYINVGEGRHDIEYRFEPPLIWKVGKILSYLGMIVFIIGNVGIWCRHFYIKLQREI
nr:hypothetical protein [uncultured Eisenbergiella sp.]